MRHRNTLMPTVRQTLADHMAKIKDRLIFETKKMDAFKQRKANSKHKVRAHEACAHRSSEKAKSKKDHMKGVDEWAKDAASRRLGGKVRDNDDDYMDRLNKGPDRKREYADKKFGHGGKRGKFKQTTNQGLDDYTGYSNKAGGNKAGGICGKSKGGAGSNRQGERARDANRPKR